MRSEIGGLAVVDARGVDAKSVDASIRHEPFSRLWRQAREVQFCDRLRSCAIRAQVGRAIFVSRIPSGPHQQNGAFRNLAMRRFPPREIVNRHTIVRSHAVRYVNHNGRSDEIRQRNLVVRLPSFGKVNGRIEMCPAMLCAGVTVRRVEPTASGLSVRQLLEVEALRIRWPEDTRV